MRARLVAIVLFGALAVLTAAVTAEPVPQTAAIATAATVRNPIAPTAESIAAGQLLFRRRCAGCHGVDATGGPPKDAGDPVASNLVDDTWDHGGSDAQIFTLINEGIGPDFRMEGFNDRFSETDTWNVINYIRSLAKK